MDYLASLVDAVSTSAGIAFHAEIVRDRLVRRRLISQCSVISETCFQNWRPTDELLDMAEQSIFDIAEDKIRRDLLEPGGRGQGTVSRNWRAWPSTRASSRECPRGSRTWTGSRPGSSPRISSSLPAGRARARRPWPSTSGTTRPVETRKGVAVFSLEMAKMQLGMRLLGFHAGIDATKLRTGFLRDTDWHEADRVGQSALGASRVHRRHVQFERPGDEGQVPSAHEEARPGPGDRRLPPAHPGQEKRRIAPDGDIGNLAGPSRPLPRI